MALGVVLAGWWSDYSSTRKVLIWGCIGTILGGLIFGPAMGSGSVTAIFLILSLALFAMGFVYGPLGAWLTALFPTQLRYTGSSIAFHAGGILGGALAPIVAQALVTGYGLASFGLYLPAAAVVRLLDLMFQIARWPCRDKGCQD